MRKLILLSLSFLFVITTYAQPTEKDRKAIEAFRVAYMTKNLDLSPEEAQKFWPVYNQMQKEMKALKQERAVKMKEYRANGNNEAMADYEIAHKQRELDLVKKHHVNLKKAIPPQKVSKLYITERNFRQELMKRVQQQRENRMNQGKPNRGPHAVRNTPSRSAPPAARPAPARKAPAVRPAPASRPATPKGR